MCSRNIRNTQLHSNPQNQYALHDAASDATDDNEANMSGKNTLEDNYKLTEYYVESVLDYTSRYNSPSSIGYAPENIVGKALRYPSYGDFPDTYTLKSYGKWDRNSVAAQSDYRPQDRDPCGAEDYIVVRFEKCVIPKEIFIYEIYNPGAVVRIWGRYGAEEWLMLWEEPPKACPRVSRRFAPPLRHFCSVVNEIRLDFHQSHLNCHTSLDAIVLVGYTPKTELQIRMLAHACLNFTIGKKKKIIIDTSDHNAKITGTDAFSSLPYEVILQIFHYLDVKTLCSCAQVNKRWYEIAQDSALYQSLSLRRYWHKVDSNILLKFFAPRCKNLRKLDLSWCGRRNRITEDTFINFMKKTGHHLTHLSLWHTDFSQKKVLKEVAECTDLIDLRLRNCQLLGYFSTLSVLTKLTALDLCACKIHSDELIEILKANPELKYLLLDFCDALDNVDLVAETVSIYNKKLEAWSSWKVRSMTCIGVCYLGKCARLKEIDLGWCLVMSDPIHCLEHLAFGCKDLRRLIVTRWRGITDNLLRPIVRHSEKLEQLHLVGIKNITFDIVETALMTLRRLEMLDVSFCDGISNEQVIYWKEKYPHVHIHRSCIYE